MRVRIDNKLMAKLLVLCTLYSTYKWPKCSTVVGTFYTTLKLLSGEKVSAGLLFTAVVLTVNLDHAIFKLIRCCCLGKRDKNDAIKKLVDLYEDVLE